MHTCYNNVGIQVCTVDTLAHASKYSQQVRSSLIPFDFDMIDAFVRLPGGSYFAKAFWSTSIMSTSRLFSWTKIVHSSFNNHLNGKSHIITCHFHHPPDGDVPVPGTGTIYIFLSLFSFKNFLCSFLKIQNTVVTQRNNVSVASTLPKSKRILETGGNDAHSAEYWHWQSPIVDFVKGYLPALGGWWKVPPSVSPALSSIRFFHSSKQCNG